MRSGLLLTMILFVSLTACRSDENPKPELESPNLKPIKLAEVYPGDIKKIDKIELLDGSSGERRTVRDKERIKVWIDGIKDIVLYPEENQESRVGFIYGIEFYEGQEKKLGFIPTAINGTYYKINEEFDKSVKAFFEEQFGRGF
jgi:hypothetical protein